MGKRPDSNRKEGTRLNECCESNNLDGQSAPLRTF